MSWSSREAVGVRSSSWRAVGFSSSGSSSWREEVGVRSSSSRVDGTSL